MTCKLNADTSDGLKITSDTSGEIDLQIDASTKVHMASDGKVGIGTTSPSYKLSLQDSGNFEIHLLKTSVADAWVRNIGNMDIAAASGGSSGQIITFSAGANYDGLAEKMRINEHGNLLVGATANYSDGGIGNPIFQLDSRAGARTGMAIRAKNTDGSAFVTTAQGMIAFVNGNGTVGSISTSGTATAFNTSSDYRLKENVDYTFDATARLKQLKPARFNFISDDTNTLVDGFLAHEVSSIVPEAITGDKDATKDVGTIKDADGNVIHENVLEVTKEDGQTWEKTSTENVYQGIDQSKLVPLLVKTIQELEARIKTLEDA